MEGMEGIHPGQAPFARKNGGAASLLETMAMAHPTVLIGVSGQAGAFTEAAVRKMASHVERPVILPLSNPTSRSEATPEDLIKWTNGRAVIGTGSPFPGVDQTNNSYVFPGVALGIIASHARRVTDGMFMAAALALAQMSPSKLDPSGHLLPPITEFAAVSFHVAEAVAKRAVLDGVADPLGAEELESAIRKHVWEPAYLRYRRSRVASGEATKLPC